MKIGTSKEVAAVIQAAGGRFVGKTRLQKTVCLLELAGYDLGFDFFYYRHGPYSENLSVAISDAATLGLIAEKSDRAQWGGTFSVFESQHDAPLSLSPQAVELVQIASQADSIELELAVTAAFLADQGESLPWEEVVSRKSQKASDVRLGKAKLLYEHLAAVKVDKPLPKLN